MSVFERVREIGIMRAVGWSSTRIAALIVSEALGICLIALGLGLLDPLLRRFGAQRADAEQPTVTFLVIPAGAKPKATTGKAGPAVEPMQLTERLPIGASP